MHHLMASHTQMMRDVIYFHEALQQAHAGEYTKALVKGINGHIKNEWWRQIKYSEVPQDVDVIPSVRPLRHKWLSQPVSLPSPNQGFIYMVENKFMA